VVWPAISADGRVNLFERDFGAWKLDTKSPKAAMEISTRSVRTGYPEHRVLLRSATKSATKRPRDS
jgi:hypothetical protein